MKHDVKFDSLIPITLIVFSVTILITVSKVLSSKQNESYNNFICSDEYVIQGDELVYVDLGWEDEDSGKIAFIRNDSIDIYSFYLDNDQYIIKDFGNMKILEKDGSSYLKIETNGLPLQAVDINTAYMESK